MQTSYNVDVRLTLPHSLSYSFKQEQIVICCANSKNIFHLQTLILVFEKKSLC